MTSSQSGRLILLAPVSGPLVPIEDVPDPVFSQKLVGDGVSIDPVSSQVLAPCDATVIQAHSAGHAVNLRSDEGVEIVIHVGLDTVELKGEGFLPRVKAGDRVRAGDALIDFAPDYVARRAKSLLTQVVVADPERFAALRRHSGLVEAGRDPILEIELGERERAAAGEPGQRLVGEPVRVPNPSGLHARPAAVLAAAAKRYRADVRVRRGKDEANAKSLTALMALEVGPGDALAFAASGPDAAEAVAALSALLAAGLGETASAAPAAPRQAPFPAPASLPSAGAAASADPRLLAGVAAAPGVVVGSAHQLRRADAPVVDARSDPTKERDHLERALAEARRQVVALDGRLSAGDNPDKAGIFAAHAELLDDPELLEVAFAAIAEGHAAAWSWQRAYAEHANRLGALKSELLRARAADVRDVGRRVLRILAGGGEAGPDVPPGSVLLAEELQPSDLASLDRTRVVGLVSLAGGATSHVAILARSLELPLLVGVEARALLIPDGTPVILDGGRGLLRLDPDPGELEGVRAQQARLLKRRRAEKAAAHQEARTLDGRRVEVAANIASLEDARHAVEQGADGVGLLRTEFLFLERAAPPSEEEQSEVLAEIARALGPERPLVARTLDVGGDKPLAYLPLPREDNPFLGVRGIRAQLAHPELLRSQLRALLRAARLTRLHVMLPMVSTLEEWHAACAIFEEERSRLGAPKVPLGIMVEVPSAALLADTFAREADFFSVGTNDLTQYTLAMDRGHPKLAPQVDGLHPAVLRLIRMAADAAHAHGRWLGVCGGLAGDPQALPILLGLGVDELSVSVPSIAEVKARVRGLELSDCRALAERALLAPSAAAVRALVEVPE